MSPLREALFVLSAQFRDEVTYLMEQSNFQVEQSNFQVERFNFRLEWSSHGAI